MSPHQNAATIPDRPAVLVFQEWLRYTGRMPEMFRHTIRRGVAGGLVLPLLGMAALGACSDDETASTCGAREDLEEALSDLADVDVVEGGTSELEAAMDEVRAALDELQSAAESEYGDEVDQIEDELGNLGDAVSDADDESAGEAAQDVSSSLSDVASGVDQLVQNVAEEC